MRTEVMTSKKRMMCAPTDESFEKRQPCQKAIEDEREREREKELTMYDGEKRDQSQEKISVAGF